ncbi:MAG: hypothetical protein JWP85_2097 [Rhodoglobus sp.]|nr:hypothetical protein [Rhodoglobus sp.]
MTRKTGAAATWNPDNIVTYWLTVGLLFAAVAAAGVGSIDGLLHYAQYIVDAPEKQWVLPVAVDVFLVATALATLALRKRRAYLAAWLTSAFTIALVSFSAYCNYTYMVSTTDMTADPASAAAPYVKAAMPILLLAATEIIAAITSTRNNRENSPLNRAHREVKKYKAEVAALKRAARRGIPESIHMATARALHELNAPGKELA